MALPPWEIMNALKDAAMRWNARHPNNIGGNLYAEALGAIEDARKRFQLIQANTVPGTIEHWEAVNWLGIFASREIRNDDSANDNSVEGSTENVGGSGSGTSERREDTES